jgi:hypothetical protein
MLECTHTAVYTDNLILLQFKSRCVIHNYAWLHLFSIFTTELHVITVPSDSWEQQTNLLYLLVHSKLLSVLLSNSGKMRRWQRPLGRQRNICDATQNLLPRSACSCLRPRPPKDHHCLPETLLPKMLVSKSSVSLIWIHIYSQLQTNTWDAFQGWLYH